MRFFKIFLCLVFISALSACHKKETTIYDYPDEDNTSASGWLGDPCEKNEDCRNGLVCLDNVCSKSSETDDKDNDSAPDEDDGKPGDDDSDSGKDDTDSGTNDGDKDDADSGKDDKDDSDSGTNDGDKDDADSGNDKDDSDSGTNDGDNQGYTPECGNGLRDPGEECDNGAENSNEPGIHNKTCRTNCTWARCQDGIVDDGEICDDGNASTGDYCSPDCHVVTGYCGDGIKQNNEVCDKALDKYCNENCSEVTGFCGDGKINGPEKCDNAEPDVGAGEGTGPYYCNVNCTEVTGSCGDGIVQLNEACDDKNNNGRYSETAPGYCNSNCTDKGPYCGDGIKQTNEVCDDGNNKNGDYCSANCKQKFGECGDGIIQDFEKCDNASFGEGNGPYCSYDCKTYYGKCGDGVIQRENCSGEGNCVEITGLGEECDRASLNGTPKECPYGPETSTCSGCTKKCKKEPGIPRYCGDGVISSDAGERCDKATYGAGIGPYYCSADCTEVIGSCGDGTIQENEVCDPKKEGDPNSPYCTNNCKKISGNCGDGEVNGNEQCDKGDPANGGLNGNPDCPYGSDEACTACTIDCKNTTGNARYCGDGVTDEPFEACDSGKTNNGHYGYCKEDCSGMGPYCGDFEQNGSEQCDDGDPNKGGLNGNFNCPYGKESCEVCTKFCKKAPGTTTAYCGDGILQRANCAGFLNCVVTPGANESCDEGSQASGGHNGEYGHCSTSCTGAGERCGDGIVTAGEVCDDEGLNGQYGHCAADCKSEGRRCGDGVVEEAQGEVCDDGENNGKYNSGTTGYCNSDCKGSGAGGFCGDGNTDSANGETCDEASDNGKIYCTYGDTSCERCGSDCRKRSGVPSYCGDHWTDESHGETCDDGAGNNKDYNAECNSTCTGKPPKCGDGIILREDCTGYTNCVVIEGLHVNEECDDKELNGVYTPYYPGHCSADCTTPGGGGYCGDNRVTDGEVCDQGRTINGTYGGNCNANCNGYTSYCGDGVTNAPYEKCDDRDPEKGGKNGTYGFCNTDCTAILECGDGIPDPVNEQCDEGRDVNGTITDCAYGEESCTLCDSECHTFDGATAYCGDGIIHREDCTGYNNCVFTPGANEECDDGDPATGGHNGEYNHCNATCSGYEPKCGDGKINREDCTGYTNCVVIDGLHVNEECDDGDENGDYGKCNQNCSGTVMCGDGEVSHGEVCDDGFMNGHYNSCDRCIINKTGWCGNGRLEKEIGTCGGAQGCYELMDADEQCDWGSSNGKVTDCAYGIVNCEVCNGTCGLEPGNASFCGDGFINRQNCTGYTNCVVTPGANEECDDGDPSTGGHNGSIGFCSSTCNGMQPYCGDGEVTAGEGCDDGDPSTGGHNGENGYCNSTCDGMQPYCGDNIVQRPECNTWKTCDEETTIGCCIVDLTMNEGCDDGENNGSQYYCYTDCSGWCGDGILQKHNCDGLDNCVVSPYVDETCDEGSLNDHPGHCNSICTGPTSVCGNGEVEKGEACDDGNTIEGDYCSADCQVETGRCGDGEPQINETCDEGKNNGFHGHCNKTCTGISSCGDGELGYDEACEPGTMESPSQCSTIPQFASTGETGIVDSCTSSCMPIFSNCEYDTTYISPFLTTGQTLCYNSAGTAISPCPAGGAAFYGQDAQFNYIPHSFETMENGEIIKDNASGLMWQTATPDIYGATVEGMGYRTCTEDLADPGKSCKYDEASLYCNYLSIGDNSNWRLPTAAELSTIADYASATHIHTGFTNTKGSYWTQEGFLFSSADGTLTPATDIDTDTGQIKCVSSVNNQSGCTSFQCKQNINYDSMFLFDSPDMIITYYYDLNSVAFTSWYFADLSTGYNWENALNFCTTSTSPNGLSKMRLPTVSELMWLFNRTNSTSMIPGFTGTAWSSTTVENAPTDPAEPASHAYAVDFSTGSVVYTPKSSSNIVICIE